MAEHATGVELRPCSCRSVSRTTSSGLRLGRVASWRWERPRFAAGLRTRTGMRPLGCLPASRCRCRWLGRQRARPMKRHTLRNGRRSPSSGTAAGASSIPVSPSGTGMSAACAVEGATSGSGPSGSGAAVAVAVYGCVAATVSGPSMGTMASVSADRGVGSGSAGVACTPQLGCANAISSSTTRCSASSARTERARLVLALCRGSGRVALVPMQ